jgi:hypothetical protein
MDRNVKALLDLRDTLNLMYPGVERDPNRVAGSGHYIDAAGEALSKVASEYLRKKAPSAASPSRAPVDFQVEKCAACDAQDPKHDSRAHAAAIEKELGVAIIKSALARPIDGRR